MNVIALCIVSSANYTNNCSSSLTNDGSVPCLAHYSHYMYFSLWVGQVSGDDVRGREDGRVSVGLGGE